MPAAARQRAECSEWPEWCRAADWRRARGTGSSWCSKRSRRCSRAPTPRSRGDRPPSRCRSTRSSRVCRFCRRSAATGARRLAARCSKCSDVREASCTRCVPWGRGRHKCICKETKGKDLVSIEGQIRLTCMENKIFKECFAGNAINSVSISLKRIPL